MSVCYVRVYTYLLKEDGGRGYACDTEAIFVLIIYECFLLCIIYIYIYIYIQGLLASFLL